MQWKFEWRAVHNRHTYKKKHIDHWLSTWQNKWDSLNVTTAAAMADDDDDAWLVVISLIPKLIFVHLFGHCGSKIKKDTTFSIIKINWPFQRDQLSMNQCDCRCCCCVRHPFYYLQHRSYQTKFWIFGMACEPGYTKVQTITSLSNGFRLSFVSFAPWWWITKTIISLFKSIQAGHLGVFVFFLSSISWVSCVIVISTTHLAVIWAVIFDNINWNHSSLLCDDPKTIIKDEKKRNYGKVGFIAVARYCIDGIYQMKDA